MEELISSFYYKMTKGSKYVRWELENMERDFESVRIRICDVGLNAVSRAYARRKLPEETFQWEKLFCRRKIIAEGQLVKIIFLRLEQYKFCITITELHCLAFKVAELNNFPPRSNKDRYRWKEMVLWIHEMALVTKFYAATC
jgi:hypothetical protein